jgi:hypothetical protein
MDGELVHPDTRPVAIVATVVIAIARFGHLPLARGICRFKVVPAVGINVIPCSYTDAFLTPALQRVEKLPQSVAIQGFPEQTDSAVFKWSPALRSPGDYRYAKQSQ